MPSDAETFPVFVNFPVFAKKTRATIFLLTAFDLMPEIAARDHS